MLPIVDRSGKLTSKLALIYSILLMPLCVFVVFLGHAGMIFLIVSSLLTFGMVVMAMRFAMTRANGDARKLFFASIIYLPLLSTALMIDARGPLSDYEITPSGYLRHDDTPFVDPESPEARQLAAPPAPANPK
jgi:heme O synthase-like polyprenyltransferase